VKRIAKAFIILGLVVAAGAGVLYLSDPIFWDRYFHARNMEHYARYPFPNGRSHYPNEPVKGVAPPRAIPVAAVSALTPEFIAKATEIAEKHNSSSLIYLQNGEIQFAKYWPDGTENRFIFGFSMAKTVGALLTGIAIDQGLIKSVDDPIGTYLTEWADDDRGKRITLRHLLTMSSGLETSPLMSANPFSKSQQRQIGTDLTSVVFSFQLVNEPGTVYDYNGINTALLGIIISRTSGMRYAEFMAKYLWQPVGNGDAQLWLDRDDGIPRTFIGLDAVPMDWLRLGKMILDRGIVGEQRIVSETWLDQMIQPSAAAPYYGFQIWVGDRKAAEVNRGAMPNHQSWMVDAGIPMDAPSPKYFYFLGTGGQVVVMVPEKSLVMVRTGPLASGAFEAQMVEMLP